MRRHPNAPCAPPDDDGNSRHRRGVVTKGGLLASTFVLAMFCFCLFAGAAGAATVYRPTGGTFVEVGSSEDQSFSFGPVAVDGTTGDVVFASRFPPMLEVFEPEGASAKFLNSFASPELGGVESMAIDQATRSLYVSDASFGRIEKYSIGGSGPLTFTLDPSFTSPTQGSGPGEIGSFSSASLAVDPTTGDLLVADGGNQRVERFLPTGTFLASFDGAGSTEGAFHNPTSVAVGGDGSIYVVDVLSDLDYPSGRSLLERFHPDGSADTAFAPPLETPRFVAADPNSGNILAMGRSNGALAAPTFPVRLYVISGDEVIDEFDYAASEVSAATRGLAVQPGGAKRLYVSSEAGGFGSAASGVKVFDSFLAPNLTISLEGFGSRSADLTGSVNPLGQPTEYHFEYSREGTPPLSTQAEAAGEGTQPVSVAGHLTGLVANSDYTVRLVANNPDVSVSSNSRSFHTPSAAPEAVTRAASNPSQTTAALSGAVNPFGEQTTYYFEYGPSVAYGSRAPLSHSATAGSGRELLPVSEEVVGLQPGASYHYRIVATNPTGTTFGADETFTTQSQLAPSRAFELVSPIEKGEANAHPHWMHATPNGDAVTYLMRTAIPGESGSAPLLSRFTATRTATGWDTVGLNPHLISAPFPSGIFLQDAPAVSEDGTKAVILSTAALAPGGTSGATNFYLYDIATGAYRFMASTPGTEAFAAWGAAFSGEGTVLGGTADFSKVFLSTESLPFPLLAGVAGPATYEWSADMGLRVVEENSSAIATPETHEVRPVSDDGSVFYYRGPTGEIRVQVDGTGAVGISGPPIGTSPELYGASADGSIAFYVNGSVLYRYDLATHSSIQIAEGIPQSNYLGASADGSYVYYVSGNGLYFWHDGESHLIVSNAAGSLNRRVSENGRYLVFGSSTPLTGYPNEGVEEMFRYDAVTGELACASCRTDGGKPRGPAELGEPSSFFEYYFARYVLNNGEVFFDTPDPLVPADVNSARDVYSFNGKEQTLISSGIGNAEAHFGDASSDGRNVFFTTTARLVKADRDDNADVYDARVGGGIPGQEAEIEGPGCAGAACRAAVAAPPSPPPGGSEGTVGRAPEKVRKHCPAGKHLVKKAGKQQCVKQKQPKKHGHKKADKNKRSAR